MPSTLNVEQNRPIHTSRPKSMGDTMLYCIYEPKFGILFIRSSIWNLNMSEGTMTYFSCQCTICNRGRHTLLHVIVEWGAGWERKQFHWKQSGSTDHDCLFTVKVVILARLNVGDSPVFRWIGLFLFSQIYWRVFIWRSWHFERK